MRFLRTPQRSRLSRSRSVLKNKIHLIGLLPLLACLVLPSEARVLSFSILYTGDLRGHLASLTPGASGGLIGVSECIRLERVKNPNTILIDCGHFAADVPDTGAISRAALYAVMDRLQYNAWVPGCRDWRQGVALFENPSCATPMLAANVFLSGRKPSPRRYAECVMDGIRFALIGMAAPNTPLCYFSGSLDGLVFDDPLETLGDIMPEVRDAEPDVVVLVLDAGMFDERAGPGLAAQIAKRFPEIDVLMTDAGKGARRIGALYYAPVELNDHRVGKVSLLYDTVQREVVQSTSDILIPPATAELPDGLSVQAWNAWESHYDEKVGVLTQALTGAEGESGESEAGRFMAHAVVDALEADGIFFRWPVGRSVSAGPVTRRDLAEAYPDDCLWGVLMLTPEEIRQAMDEVRMYQGSDKAMGSYGFRCSADENPEMRVTGEHGEPLHPRKRYRIAVAQDVMASSGGVYPVFRTLAENPLTRRMSSTVDIYEAVIKYIHSASGGDTGHE